MIWLNYLHCWGCKLWPVVRNGYIEIELASLIHEALANSLPRPVAVVTLAIAEPGQELNADVYNLPYSTASPRATGPERNEERN